MRESRAMSIERLFRCDGPECERFVQTTRMHPELFITVSEDGDELHFCGWDCVLRFAATKEPETVVPGPSALD